MENLQIIQNKIFEIRGQKVMLDRDLATLYCVETKILNKAVSRNAERFPERFMFQLTKEECSRFQIGTLNDSENLGGRGHNIKYTPYAFTEQGVAMLSAVLHSPTAIKACVIIMDAFVQMRTYLASEQLDAAKLQDFKRRLERLEQSHESDLIGLPSQLSEHIQIIDYSELSVVILTSNKRDRLLLKAIGAGYNSWLKYQGIYVAGYVYPKSRMETLLKYVPESVKERQRKNAMS